MASTAVKRMTAEEFLVWDDRTDTRHELIDGRPVAMAPAKPVLGLLSTRLSRHIDQALDAWPGCNVFAEVGIRATRPPNSFFIADLAVSRMDRPGFVQELHKPLLIVEVLSPLTERIDRHRKVFDYRFLPSVLEIVLIDSGGMFCEVYHRKEANWFSDILCYPDSWLRLESVGLAIPLGELYAGMTFDDAEAG